jgi:hypothetical protein
MPITTPFLILFLLLGFLLVDVIDPIKSRVRNRKYGLPLVSSGLLQSEEEFASLEWFLQKEGRTLEEFEENGVPLKNLKDLKLDIELTFRRLWEVQDEMDEIDPENGEKERLSDLQTRYSELVEQSVHLEEQMWGNLKR